MLDRIIDWIKSIFHEETPEEQDKRIQETIKSVTKDELQSLREYKSACGEALLTTQLMVGQQYIPERHLILWNLGSPLTEDKYNALDALLLLHDAHIYLSEIYSYDVTYPPNDPRYGTIKEHVDIRPAKWLKDLADEEKRIKALQMKADAKQYQV